MSAALQPLALIYDGQLLKNGLVWSKCAVSPLWSSHLRNECVPNVPNFAENLSFPSIPESKSHLAGVSFWCNKHTQFFSHNQLLFQFQTTNAHVWGKPFATAGKSTCEVCLFVQKNLTALPISGNRKHVWQVFLFSMQWKHMLPFWFRTSTPTHDANIWPLPESLAQDKKFKNFKLAVEVLDVPASSEVHYGGKLCSNLDNLRIFIVHCVSPPSDI